MASDEYWNKTKTKILDPEFGAFAHYPSDVIDLLKGSVMDSSLGDYIKFKILLMPDKAESLLENFLPQLREILSDQKICDELRNPTELRPPSIIYNLEILAVGTWLSSGKYDKVTLERIMDEIDRDPEYRPKTIYAPIANSAILAAVELGNDQIIEKYYNHWEKRPLDTNPSNLRFSTNLRHLLYAHVKYGSCDSTQNILNEGMSRMADRARNWDKIDAVPFVDIVVLARTVFICNHLCGHQFSHADLWPMLK